MEKQTPGRPRLYATASDKLNAFRDRQEAAGYLRKELLVTKETWERISVLAKTHGVSAADAASGLLESGLVTFETQTYGLGLGGGLGEPLRKVGAAKASVLVPAVNPSGQGVAPTRAGRATEGTCVNSTPLASLAPATPSTSRSALAKDGASVASNPVTNFFSKRKEHLNACQN